MLTPTLSPVQTELEAYLEKPYLTESDTNRLNLLCTVLNTSVTIRRTHLNTGLVETITLPMTETKTNTGLDDTSTKHETETCEQQTLDWHELNLGRQERVLGSPYVT